MNGIPASTNVYEWEDGVVSLISSGESGSPSVLGGTTPSGDDVFFIANAVLTAQGNDGGYENVYDARVGGGFPAPVEGAPGCVGEACRAVFGAPPVFSPPGSATFQGPGNFPAPAPEPAVKPKPKAKVVTCGRGFVKKRVKGRDVCVRKRKATKRGAGK